jgi:uncharacterized repeat protein (TIGR01451 family)
MRNHPALLLALLAVGCAALEGTPPARRVENGVVWVTQAIPSGKKSTSAILVERGTPERVPLGRPYDYEIRVTNLTNHDLNDVVVQEFLGEGAALNHAEPVPASTAPRLARWDFGTLAAGQKVSIHVNATPGTTGELASRCQVDYRALVGGAVMVVEPKLALESAAPAQSLVDETVGVRLTVKNPGTGDASGVVITGELPEGLRTEEGQTAVHIEVGTLPAGATKEYVVNVKGSRTGAFALKASASSGEGLAAETGPVALEFRRPRLELTAQAPVDWLLDRPLACALKVRNTGDGEARGARVEVELAEGLRYVGASEGVEAAGPRIAWGLGTLAPGQERALELRVSATRPGEMALRVRATAEFAEAVSAETKTRLVGVPALGLEVVDDQDPIAVGGEVTYTITVRNQGSAADHNVKVDCTLEEGMALVDASGATKREGAGEGRSLSFMSLDTLEPDRSAVWKVRVKAEKAGDFRFRVSLTSGQMERPVGETEATRFYQ